MLPWEVLKRKVTLMPFRAFWGEILYMEWMRNEEKLLGILMKPEA